MIPTAFEYVRAKNLNHALRAMGKHAKVIAGGHSLLPLLKLRLAQPGRLVDIGHLSQLKGIKAAGSGLRIGAGTTYTARASPAARSSVASSSFGAIATSAAATTAPVYGRTSVRASGAATAGRIRW